MKTTRCMIVLVATVLLVVAGSCQFPWLDPREGEEESDPVSLVLGSLPRTIRPDPVAPGSLVYRLTLTPVVGTPLVFENYTLGTSITDQELVVGEWTILAEGFYGGNMAYPAFTGTATEVLAGGSNVVNLDLVPQQLNDGTIYFALNWPPELVDDVYIDWLLNLGDPGTPLDPGMYTLDMVSGQLVISGSWPSGRYYLGVSLSRNTKKVAGIYEVLRVYDALPSVGTVVLDASRLSKPPAQPGALTVNHPGSSIDISWIDLSNTEEGYRVYRKKDGDPDFTQMGSDLLPGTSMTWDPNAITYPGGLTVQYRVVAFNDFGESPYSEITYRLLPNFSGAFVPNMEQGFDSYFGAQLSWAPIIGADGLELWMGTAPGSLSLKTSLGPSSMGYYIPETDLSPMATYYWQVRAMNTTGMKSSPEMHFMTRDAVWHVVPALGNNSGKGSSDHPLATIQEALNRMPASGGLIRLGAQPGGALYNEALTLDKPILMEGNWNQSFIMQDPVNTKTTISSSTSQFSLKIDGGANVELRDLRVENSVNTVTNNYAIWVSNGNLLVEDAEISAGGMQAQRGGAFQLSGTSNLTLRRNQIWAGESTQIVEGYGIDVPGTYSGQLIVGGPNPADQNIFKSSQGSGAMHHIRLGPDLPSGTPVIMLQNNLFEPSTSSGDSWIYGIRAEIPAADLQILGNTIHGGSNTGLNSIWGAYIDSTVSLEIRGNKFEMGADGNSPQTALEVRGAGPQAIIDANRVRMQLMATQQNTGISLYRSSLVTNNVIVQEGAASGTTGFKGINIFGGAGSIINNTIVNRSFNDVNSVLIRANTGTASNLIATNNLLWASTSTSYGIRNDDSMSPVEIKNNSFFGMTFPYYDSVNSGTVLATLNGLGFALDNLITDPKLSTLGTIDAPTWYANGSATPANLGSAGSVAHSALVPFDILKVPRLGPVGIGAYQGPVSHLVARWQFLSGTELEDSTAFGNTLASNGTPAFGELSLRRHVQFVSANDSLGAFPSPGINQITTGQSISFWMYGNVLNQGSMINRYDGSGNAVWRIGSNVNGQLNVLDSNGYIGGMVYDFGTVGGGLVANQWNHVVVVLTTGVSTSMVFVNGVQAPSNYTYNNPAMLSASGQIFLGETPWDATPAGDAWIGRMADVRVYNYPLDSGTIAEIHSGIQ